MPETRLTPNLMLNHHVPHLNCNELGYSSFHISWWRHVFDRWSLPLDWIQPWLLVKKSPNFYWWFLVKPGQTSWIHPLLVIFFPFLCDNIENSWGKWTLWVSASFSISFSSWNLREVKKGQLEVMGALFDNKTGRVEFMGLFGDDHGEDWDF